MQPVATFLATDAIATMQRTTSTTKHLSGGSSDGEKWHKNYKQDAEDPGDNLLKFFQAVLQQQDSEAMESALSAGVKVSNVCIMILVGNEMAVHVRFLFALRALGLLLYSVGVSTSTHAQDRQAPYTSWHVASQVVSCDY
jgi:hypothetical protein